MSNKEVSFIGDVIRLNKDDFDSWYQHLCYWMTKSEYLDKLEKLDIWLTKTNSKYMRKNWFMIVSQILRREMEERNERT